jgi:hypothetical protein
LPTTTTVSPSLPRSNLPLRKEERLTIDASPARSSSSELSQQPLRFLLRQSASIIAFGTRHLRSSSWPSVNMNEGSANWRPVVNGSDASSVAFSTRPGGTLCGRLGGSGGWWF